MKIMVVGSGGREHALVWKLSQSPKVEKIFCSPGNAGTAQLGDNIPIPAEDVKGLKQFAAQEKIGLTVVGPEAPLTKGIVDEFEESGLMAFGPNKMAAELEGSKIFAKQFMDRHKIPTAQYRIAKSAEEARQIIKAAPFPYPLVIKADGLAAGKGVMVCKNQIQTEEAVRTIMEDKKFGDAGDKIIIEEFLRGKEASFIVISDGVKVVPFVTTMDHKAVYDGGHGPNTGGMGAISPSPFINREIFNEVVKTVIFPTITRMLEEGRKYRGVLYAGLMLTKEGPKVLEYNCRFGDPETQPQMLRLETDLVDIMTAALEENILGQDIQWARKSSACVVLASGGYPLKYEKGKEVRGIESAREIEGVTIFHAGTRVEDDRVFTSGGRVLNVCACEDNLPQAMEKIYSAVSKIEFEGMHYRKDIGTAEEEKS
jgi:phosphoribosylamine---glycine ligase